jgi:hypothetical protein
MPYKTSSWKDKVDPAVISVMRTFLRLVESMDEVAIKKRSEEITRCLNEKGQISFKRFYENKNNTEFGSQYVEKALAFRKANPDLLENSEKQKQFREKIPPELSLWLTFQVLNIACMKGDKKSLYSLYEEARSGKKPKSLLKILRYDKTLFDHEWVREKIFKEALVGNHIFFDELGDAIKREPKKSRHEIGWRFMLIYFWQIVFNKLEEDEQMEVLQEIGLKIPDRAKYRKIIRTEIKPLFK